MGSRLVIELMPDGQLSLQGPLQDKILCYGLLELAKEVISKHKSEANPIAMPKPNELAALSLAIQKGKVQ